VLAAALRVPVAAGLLPSAPDPQLAERLELVAFSLRKFVGRLAGSDNSSNAAASVVSWRGFLDAVTCSPGPIPPPSSSTFTFGLSDQVQVSISAGASSHARAVHVQLYATCCMSCWQPEWQTLLTPTPPPPTTPPSPLLSATYARLLLPPAPASLHLRPSHFSFVSNRGSRGEQPSFPPAFPFLFPSVSHDRRLPFLPALRYGTPSPVFWTMPRVTLPLQWRALSLPCHHAPSSSGRFWVKVGGLACFQQNLSIQRLREGQHGEGVAARAQTREAPVPSAAVAEAAAGLACSLPTC
jgi:hypothetical protein